MDIKEEEIQILYNSCYGGWSLSNKAYELYNLRKNENSNKLKVYTRRSDPILIQIYYELGDEFDDKYSRTMVETIPKKYEYCYYIQAYDGLENVIIDYTKYKLDEIKNKLKEILENSTINNDEKINKLQEFMSVEI